MKDCQDIEVTMDVGGVTKSVKCVTLLLWNNSDDLSDHSYTVDLSG
jgi:hypothetical protein